MKCVYHRAKNESENKLVQVTVCEENGVQDCSIHAAGYKTTAESITAAADFLKSVLIEHCNINKAENQREELLCLAKRIFDGIFDVTQSEADSYMAEITNWLDKYMP